MKKILSVLAAVVLSGAIASAAYIPTFTGPQEPSQIFNYLNQLIGSTISGTNGIVASLPGAVASTATTAEQTLASSSIVGNTISRAGQALRLRCSGNFANTTHASTTVKLYYGTAAVTSVAATTSSQGFDLGLLVTNVGGAATPTSSEYVGTGTVGLVQVATVATTNATDDLSTALTAKCTTTQGTASASDVVLTNFVVEQVK